MAIPPPPGYVPGNEARSLVRFRGTRPRFERLHTLRDDQVSLGVIRFYPDDSNRICRSVGGKPFGFGLRRLNGGFPLLPFPDECVTALIPLPRTGLDDRDHLDCEAILHP